MKVHYKDITLEVYKLLMDWKDDIVQQRLHSRNKLLVTEEEERLDKLALKLIDPRVKVIKKK